MWPISSGVFTHRMAATVVRSTVMSATSMRVWANPIGMDAGTRSFAPVRLRIMCAVARSGSLCSLRRSGSPAALLVITLHDVSFRARSSSMAETMMVGVPFFG